MAREADPLGEILPLIQALEEKGLQPVLVGGMALVVLGSQRVTKDFDFLISSPALSQGLVGMIYRQGYQLVATFNKTGEVKRTIDNPAVAAARLKRDKPSSVSFHHGKTGLRVDLLLNFPLPPGDIAARAAKIGKKPHTLRVAAPEDLLHLKELAYADRKSAADTQDLEFLRNLLQGRS